MANESSVDWGFRIDVPHRHLEMWLRRKRPATFTFRVARRFLRFRDLLAATLCRAFSDGSPTWRPSSNWRCGQCPAAYLLVAFDQDAAKELQHLLPPFPQIVRDRAGGCLTISGAAFCNILMASFFAACSETRLHACRHVHVQGAIENHRSTVAGTMLQIAERGFFNERRPSFVEGRSTSSLAATAQSLLKDVFNRTREVFHGTRDGSTFQGSS